MTDEPYSVDGARASIVKGSVALFCNGEKTM